MKPGAILWLSVLIVAFAIFSYRVKSELLSEASPIKSLKLGQGMPDFTLPDPEGKQVTLKSVTGRNRLVLVNFWATWCGPCRLEMPQFEKVFQKHRDEGFQILAISEDEEAEALNKYLKEKPVSFRVLADAKGDLAKQFGIRAYPTSILIQNGKIIKVSEGVDPYMEYQVDAFAMARNKPAGKQ